MTLPPGLPEPDINAVGTVPVPFEAATVTLTKPEHIQLVMDVAYWSAQVHRRVARDARRERSYRRFFDQLKEHGAKREAVLIAELEVANAKIRDLQQRVFGRKTERGRCVSERAAHPGLTRAPRGQRPGSAGHGRTMQTGLPRRSEHVKLDVPQCPQCGLELGVFPGTEDSEVLEIEVQAYRRVIRRQRYHPRCRCGCMPGIVSAPAPARLIERGKYGVSVPPDGGRCASKGGPAPSAAAAQGHACGDRARGRSCGHVGQDGALHHGADQRCLIARATSAPPCACGSVARRQGSSTGAPIDPHQRQES